MSARASVGALLGQAQAPAREAQHGRGLRLRALRRRPKPSSTVSACSSAALLGRGVDEDGRRQLAVQRRRGHVGAPRAACGRRPRRPADRRGAAAATRAGTGSCRRGRDRPSRGSRRRRRRAGPAPRCARRPTRARSSPGRTTAGRSARGRSAGPPASARWASAMQVGAGSLAWRATSAATARTSRGTCAWSAARRMARMREARRGAVAASSIPAPVAIDSSSTRARPRLSASRAAARSMTSIAWAICSRRPRTWARTSAAPRRTSSSSAACSASRRWASPSGWPAVASATPSSSRIRARAPGAGGSARTRRR